MQTDDSIGAVVINQPGSRICSLNTCLGSDRQFNARKNFCHDFTRYQTLALFAEWSLCECEAVSSAAIDPSWVCAPALPEVPEYEGTVPV